MYSLKIGTMSYSFFEIYSYGCTKIFIIKKNILINTAIECIHIHEECFCKEHFTGKLFLS